VSFFLSSQEEAEVHGQDDDADLADRRPSETLPKTTVLYILVGLRIESSEQIQYAQLPVAAIALAVFVVVTLTIRDPDSTIMRVFMYVPMCAPFAASVRLLDHLSSTNEMVLSASLTAAFIGASHLMLNRWFAREKG